MRDTRTSLLASTLLLAAATTASALTRGGFELQVVADGMQRPELTHRGTTYIEALRGKEFTLRLHNPLGVRVAVALAVDGLNTIDARHTSAAGAAKWVIEPYGTVEITGWQVSGDEARRFYFTGERDSYGAWLGETENLGVLEAVFFREKTRPTPITRFLPWSHKGRDSEGAASGAPAPRSEASREKEAQGLADSSAATGIGERVDNPVESVHLDLEPTPAAQIRIRYEFRSELIRMGVLPQPHEPWPWNRREHAEGFAFCPDPH